MSELEKSRIECLTRWADDNKIEFTETQVSQIVKTTMDFRKFNIFARKALKENRDNRQHTVVVARTEVRENYYTKKKEIKNQQRVERLAQTFPSQEELFTHIVHSALKPSKFR